MTSQATTHCHHQHTQSPVVISGREFTVGTGFSARQFRHGDFEGLMDPLLMVDDYTMTEPTFGAHPHAGIAAVSVLFEETEGLFYNHDSLDNHLALGAGDLYWLNAGKGAMHDESPLSGVARIRGLQMFIKLPMAQAAMAPESHHVSAASIPSIESPGVRVRVVAGESNGQSGFTSFPVPTTVLDGYLQMDSQFVHDLGRGQSAWVYAVDGAVALQVGEQTHHLETGQAIALGVPSIRKLTVKALRKSHFVVVAATPLNEPFVQQGPFALANMEEIEMARADAEAGRMGRAVEKPITNR